MRIGRLMMETRYFSEKTNTNRFNSQSRSWCWIGDGKRVGPQHVDPSDHEAWWWVSDDLEMHGGFWFGSVVQN